MCFVRCWTGGWSRPATFAAESDCAAAKHNSLVRQAGYQAFDYDE